MHKLFLPSLLATATLIGCSDTNAAPDTEPLAHLSENKPMCENIISDIELDFRFVESEFTSENAHRSIEFMKSDLRNWMEDKYQSLKANPKRDDGLIEGEIGISYFNSIALFEGYILYLEAKSASGPDTSAKVSRFCEFLATQVRAD